MFPSPKWKNIWNQTHQTLTFRSMVPILHKKSQLCPNFPPHYGLRVSGSVELPSWGWFHLSNFSINYCQLVVLVNRWRPIDHAQPLRQTAVVSVSPEKKSFGSKVRRSIYIENIFIMGNSAIFFFSPFVSEHWLRLKLYTYLFASFCYLSLWKSYVNRIPLDP